MDAIISLQNVFVVVDLYGMIESVSVISTATIGSEGSVSTPSVESETGHQIPPVSIYLFSFNGGYIL